MTCQHLYIHRTNHQLWAWWRPCLFRNDVNASIGQGFDPHIWIYSYYDTYHVQKHIDVHLIPQNEQVHHSMSWKMNQIIISPCPQILKKYFFPSYRTSLKCVLTRVAIRVALLYPEIFPLEILFRWILWVSTKKDFRSCVSSRIVAFDGHSGPNF